MRLLLRRLPEGLQAVDDEDLPAGRRRRRRALRRRRARRAHPRRATAAPRGVAGDGHERRRLDDRRSTVQRADGGRRRRVRSSRRRCCCARASAARRPAGTCACTRRRWSAASTRSRSRAGSGRSSRRSRTSSSSCEGEHGLPDRGDDRGAGDRRDVAAVGGRRARTSSTMQRKLRHIAPFISVARDHGEGQVVIDEHGRAVTRWSFDDDVDARMFRRAMVELAQAAPRGRRAGRSSPSTSARSLSWREGEDFDAFLAQIEEGSLAANDIAAFTRAPDGLLPDGLGSRRVGRRRARRSCTTRPACGSATPPPSRPRRA